MNQTLFSFDSCSVVLPSLDSWIYAISVHGACCVLGSIPLGIILYFLSKGSATKSTLPITIPGVLMGFGTAIFVHKERRVVESFSPNDEITWIGPLLSSTFGFSTFFKCMNVAFGTFPEGADCDLSTWLFWFAMTPEPSFSKGKCSKASWNEILDRVKNFGCNILVLFINLSIMLKQTPPYYRVLEKNETGFDHFKLSFADHVNGFLHLWLLYSFFAFCLNFSAITNYFSSGGIRMEPGFCNPLLASRCYKETWGTRWNRPVNLLLKRTIYIPLRRARVSAQISAMLTFLGSGFLHEYNFSIINHQSLVSPGGYRPGEVTGFFLFMGLLMVCESWVWNFLFPLWLRTKVDRLPSPVTASFLTFLVAGLAEKYFLRGWFESGFVEAVAQMIPHVACT